MAMRVEITKAMKDARVMAGAMGAELLACGTPPLRLAGITNDSREVREGDLFVVLEGQYQSGSLFIREAIERGAAGIVTREPVALPQGDYWLFGVEDAARALLKAASVRRDITTARVVAISGSAGKTTVKEAVSAVLAAEGGTVAKSAGNYNSLLGMPLSLLGMPEADHFVAEVGINHPGEMLPMSYCLRPNVAVLTNVGTAHLGNFRHTGELIAEKCQIAVGQGEGDILLLPGDLQLPRSFRPKSEILRVGTHSGADFQAVNICMNEKGVKADIKCKERVLRDLVWHVPGSIGVFALLFATAVGMIEGKSDEAILCGIEAAKLAVPRMRLLSVGTRRFLDDTYNASPEAVKAAIETARILAGERPLVAVLGDMLELGELTAPLHFTVGAFAAAHGVGQIFAYGKYAAAVAQGARAVGLPTSCTLCFSEGEERELVAELLSQTPKNAFLLFKASRRMALDRVVENTRRGV